MADTLQQGLGTRAVLRVVQPGTHEACSGCFDKIRFRGRKVVTRQVICNVYTNGKWDRVEHWHQECYDDRYGEVNDDA